MLRRRSAELVEHAGRSRRGVCAWRCGRAGAGRGHHERRQFAAVRQGADGRLCGRRRRSRAGAARFGRDRRRRRAAFARDARHRVANHDRRAASRGRRRRRAGRTDGDGRRLDRSAPQGRRRSPAKTCCRWAHRCEPATWCCGRAPSCGRSKSPFWPKSATAWSPCTRGRRVAVLPTGNELVAVGERPAAGQIRNSNGPMLVAAAARARRDGVELAIARDDRERSALADRRRALGGHAAAERRRVGRQVRSRSGSAGRARRRTGLSQDRAPAGQAAVVWRERIRRPAHARLRLAGQSGEQLGLFRIVRATGDRGAGGPRLRRRPIRSPHS